jgi:hypothetical protein
MFFRKIIIICIRSFGVIHFIGVVKKKNYSQYIFSPRITTRVDINIKHQYVLRHNQGCKSENFALEAA